MRDETRSRIEGIIERRTRKAISRPKGLDWKEASMLIKRVLFEVVNLYGSDDLDPDIWRIPATNLGHDHVGLDGGATTTLLQTGTAQVLVEDLLSEARRPLRNGENLADLLRMLLLEKPESRFVAPVAERLGLPYARSGPQYGLPDPTSPFSKLLRLRRDDPGGAIVNARRLMKETFRIRFEDYLSRRVGTDGTGWVAAHLLDDFVRLLMDIDAIGGNSVLTDEAARRLGGRYLVITGAATMLASEKGMRFSIDIYSTRVPSAFGGGRRPGSPVDPTAFSAFSAIFDDIEDLLPSSRPGGDAEGTTVSPRR